MKVNALLIKSNIWVSVTSNNGKIMGLKVMNHVKEDYCGTGNVISSPVLRRRYQAYNLACGCQDHLPLESCWQFNAWTGDILGLCPFFVSLFPTPDAQFLRKMPRAFVMSFL